MFKCRYCGKEYEKKSSLSGHISGHVRRNEVSKEQTDVYKRANPNKTCQFCSKTFSTAALRAGHERHDHSPWESLERNATRRKRLINEQGHKCSVCLNETWCGQPIPLEIDHIDGNPDNNAKSNCRILCPNCHAQTPTYKGKNIGNIDGTIRQKVMARYPSYRKKNKKHKNNIILNKLINSNIDFQKHGWIKEASKIIGISENKARKWIKRELPKFHEEHCSKQRIMDGRSKDPMYDRKYGTREDFHIAKNKKYEEQSIKLIEKIINSNIDCSKWGWISKVAKLIGKNYTEVRPFVKRFAPDFYESKCRKDKNGN